MKMAKVLVVDDENNIRTMIRLTLEHSGHTVETAADGQEGLDKFGAGAGIDVVLLDQRMPDLEGITVLKQMLFHNPSARIIMITAFGTVDLAVEAMKSGATDFMRKPFTAETLRGAVEVALRGGGNDASGSYSSATFGMTTINGYRIEAPLNSGVNMGGDVGYEFTVRNPSNEARRCTIVMPAVVAELVKAHADREEMPGGIRFWQALCEEVLANYLYQHADFPPEGILKVEDYTTGMHRWVEAVLAV
jgi:CheY-like chemotaxis protein